MVVAFLAADEHPLGFGESGRISKPQVEMKQGEDVAADPNAALPRRRCRVPSDWT